MSQTDDQPVPGRDDDEVERLKRRMVKFKESYSYWEKTADRFRKDVEANLSQLMKQNEIVPAVLESRVKSLDSAVRKVESLDTWIMHRTSQPSDRPSQLVHF